MNAEKPTSAPRLDDGASELAGFLRSLPRSGESVLGSPPLPEVEAVARQVTAREDLAGRFAAMATAAGLRVHRVNDAGWIGEIREILRAAGAASAFIAPLAGSALPPDRADALRASLSSNGIGIKPNADDETLFGVAASVTGVSAAVAETGTIICQSGANLARGASLIPPLHIAVVDVSQIVPDLYDAFAALVRAGQMPANVNLITGPSKTADIEGILVTGVHGPGEVHVVLIG